MSKEVHEAHRTTKYYKSRKSQPRRSLLKSKLSNS